MVPASVQICPVEIPGRGRRFGEPSISDVKQLARLLARSLPLSDKPYAIFGTCLGAIVGYEVVREVERSGCAPLPVAFMPAAVSPPHLYAVAVMKLYLQRKLGESPVALLLHYFREDNRPLYMLPNLFNQGSSSTLSFPCCVFLTHCLNNAGRNEAPPVEEVMAILRTWQDLPKETLLKAFEAGNFAGVEEMKRSDRLFERVAPMGVNDIMMAVQYR